MKTMKMVLVSALAAAVPAMAGQRKDAFRAVRNDRCAQQVISIARGLQGTFANTEVLSLELTSEEEFRYYNLALDVDGAINTYEITLDNDSAIRCLPMSVERKQAGG